MQLLVAGRLGAGYGALSRPHGGSAQVTAIGSHAAGLRLTPAAVMCLALPFGGSGSQPCCGVLVPTPRHPVAVLLTHIDISQADGCCVVSLQVEKGTQGVDSRVVNPRSKGVQQGCSLFGLQPQQVELAPGLCRGGSHSWPGVMKFPYAPCLRARLN